MRVNNGEYDDFEHCTDATALVAAARWALEQGARAAPSPSPFRDEKASLAALHDELLFCAENTFSAATRTRRNPATWTSQELAAGASDPAAFIKEQRIGYPQRAISPLRKIGWWFNVSVLQFGLMAQARLTLTDVQPGKLQPATCP